MGFDTSPTTLRFFREDDYEDHKRSLIKRGWSIVSEEYWLSDGCFHAKLCPRGL